MSYTYRKDFRSDKEFARDIKNRSKKEQFLIQTWKKEMEARYFKVEIKDNGVDNTGKVIKGRVSADADYLVSIAGDAFFKMDVKNSYVGYKWTFKISNLRNYVKNDVTILIFYDTGNINKNLGNMDYSSAKWGYISPENIQKMLDDKKDSYYTEIKFGGKLCLQITEDEFETYIDSIERITYV
jgi:hypothetical protein